MSMNKLASTAIDSLKTFAITAGAAAACAICAAPAAAQTTNANAAPPAATPPSYATTEDSIRGRIAGFDGKYDLQLRDDRGFIDKVRLHDGTIINPTGLRLSPGQSVTILGHNAGSTFDANEIDTPYASYGVPVYAYGYPYYGYPYYGVGVGFRGFGYGGRGWF
jgi:hypothetical protein